MNPSQWRFGVGLIVSLGSALSGIGTVAGFFGRQWWVFELASHFRVQYFFMFLLGTGFFLIEKRYLPAVFTGVLAVFNLSGIAFFSEEALARHKGSGEERQVLKALLLNVKKNNRASSKVIQFIQTASPEVVILLEVDKRWMAELDVLRGQYPYKKSYVRRNYGIALFSQLPYESAEILGIGNHGSPSLISRFRVQGNPFLLIGAHPVKPIGHHGAQSRNRQLDQLAHFATHQNIPLVLLGDLNVTPWSPYFQDFLNASGLHDTRNGFGIQSTWPVQFPLLRIPIDHCLVSSGVLVHGRQIGPNVGSDHYPVLVDFSLN